MVAMVLYHGHHSPSPTFVWIQDSMSDASPHPHLASRGHRCSLPHLGMLHNPLACSQIDALHRRCNLENSHTPHSEQSDVAIQSSSRRVRQSLLNSGIVVHPQLCTHSLEFPAHSPGGICPSVASSVPFHQILRSLPHKSRCTFGRAW